MVKNDCRQCSHKVLTIIGSLWADTVVGIGLVVLHAHALVAWGRVTQNLPGLTLRANEAISAGALEVVHQIRAVAAMETWIWGTVICGKVCHIMLLFVALFETVGTLITLFSPLPKLVSKWIIMSCQLYGVPSGWHHSKLAVTAVAATWRRR